MEKKNKQKAALKAAFPHTIPVMAGYVFLGITYGIYAGTSGLPGWMPVLMAAVIFAGSVEFLTVDMLVGAFHPLQSFLMALIVNARHLFYGLAMLKKYQNTGKKKAYLIFGMADEAFSINCSVQIPEGIDHGWFYFFVTLLDQIYWVGGAALGTVVGSLLHFNTEGLDFVMTAMFVVIFLDNFLKEKEHASSWIGLLVPLVCLILFGADGFMIPSMIGIFLALTLMRPRLDREAQGTEPPINAPHTDGRTGRITEGQGSH